MSLGEEIDALTPSRTYAFAIISFLNYQPGVVKSVVGLDKVRELPGLLHISLNIAPGLRLNPSRDGSSRQGCSIAAAQALKELQALSQRIHQELRVTYA